MWISPDHVCAFGARAAPSVLGSVLSESPAVPFISDRVHRVGDFGTYCPGKVGSGESVLSTCLPSPEMLEVAQ